MRAAYYQGTALTGKGQNIGLLEFLGFDIADVNTYDKGYFSRVSRKHFLCFHRSRQKVQISEYTSYTT
jgi:hypothetical protein